MEVATTYTRVQLYTSEFLEPTTGAGGRTFGRRGALCLEVLSDLGRKLRRLSERPAAEQDFERFEGEVHQLFAVAEPGGTGARVGAA